jgi:hypothetical protein
VAQIKNNISKTSVKSTSTISPEKLVEEISKRAYEIHLKRGATPGSDMDDWLKAEKEIKAKYHVA